MRFLESNAPASEEQIAKCEAACGVTLPAPLKACYSKSNGGVPEPYVFENDDLDTVVSEFLPLVLRGPSSAVRTYLTLVRERKIVPARFFPFAVDGGGDYFLVDTASRKGAVYFFRGDSDGPDRLLSLYLGVLEFWEALKPE